MAQILTTNKRYWLGADQDGNLGGAGIYCIGVQGSFNGATVSLQWSIDKGTTWTPNNTQSTDFTANGSDVFYVCRPDEMIFSIYVTGGTSPDLNFVVGQAISRK